MYPINFDCSREKSKDAHELSELTKANSESFIQRQSQKWNFYIFSWEISSSTGFPWCSARRILLPLQWNVLTRFLVSSVGSISVFQSHSIHQVMKPLPLKMCFKRFFLFKYLTPSSTHNKRCVIYYGHFMGCSKLFVILKSLPVIFPINLCNEELSLPWHRSQNTIGWRFYQILSF